MLLHSLGGSAAYARSSSRGSSSGGRPHQMAQRSICVCSCAANTVPRQRKLSVVGVPAVSVPWSTVNPRCNQRGASLIPRAMFDTLSSSLSSAFKSLDANAKLTPGVSVVSCTVAECISGKMADWLAVCAELPAIYLSWAVHHMPRC